MSKWVEQIALTPDLIVYVKPLTFRHMNQTTMKAFETNRIMNMVNDDSLSDDKKMEMFNTSFSNLTKITVDLMSEAIVKVVAGDDEVTDKHQILEFVHNIDRELFEKISHHLAELKSHNQLKPIEFGTSEEQQAAGAPATYTVPISFNETDFFA
jgi:hypothetical protein